MNRVYGLGITGVIFVIISWFLWPGKDPSTISFTCMLFLVLGGAQIAAADVIDAVLAELKEKK